MKTIGDTKVYHWSEIQESFRSADIFLGNGFSINIDEALNYKSLFTKFLGYLRPEEQTIFRKFNSTNFEGIQNKLSDALEVSSIFGHSVEELSNALSQLKTGLLRSIKDLHPNYSSIDHRTILSLSQKLDWFGDIYTTNYDVFLYHIVLTTLDRQRKDKSVIRFQDFFRSGEAGLVFTDQALKSFRNIYYLHGGLFLFNENGSTVKIRRGDKTDELLDLIKLRIHTGQTPLFVSEGKSAQKQAAISQSKYLSFCQDAFGLANNAAVIYGFSFSSSDDHLIETLNKGKRRLGIGLHLSDGSANKILRSVRHIGEKLYRYSQKEIKFFDSRTLF